MADTQEPTITAPVSAAPAADPVSSSVVVTPPASGDAGDSSAPVVTDSKPIEAVVEAVGAKPEVKAETSTPSVTESILGDEKPVVEKPKEEVKTETNTETKVETPKVELPTYEAFKLPENVALDKEPLDAFSKILGEIETGKLDHAGMQAKGQALIDLAAKATTDSINRLNDYYVQIHETQKKDWFEAAKKDPDLGNGDEKIFGEIASNLRSSIDTYAGSSDQQKEFRTLMKDTGVGNHPALLRMLNNMQKKIDSYTKETSGRAVPAQAPAPSKQKAYNTFYQGNNG